MKGNERMANSIRAESSDGNSLHPDGAGGTDGPPDVPQMIYTMRLPRTTPMPTITDKWRREGGEIVASYTTQEWQLRTWLADIWSERHEQVALWEEKR